MDVALIDYGSGNLRSAAKALERVGARVRVTDRADDVARAERIVLPGVGAFADCSKGLGKLGGMREALEEAVRQRGRPFLGICVGMQLMAGEGREHGVHAGLGWIEGAVVAIEPAPGPDGRPLKVPHMGWNELGLRRDDHPVFAGLASGEHMYFLHSYHLRAARDADCLAEADYGGPVVAAVARDNLVGTQFHPEKSQAAGLRLLANFIAWRP